MTTTVTEQKCSKVCGGGGDGWGWGGKKGRKLQGGKAGKLITVVVSKPSKCLLERSRCFILALVNIAERTLFCIFGIMSLLTSAGRNCR